jgi:hypothetical protein
MYCKDIVDERLLNVGTSKYLANPYYGMGKVYSRSPFFSLLNGE